MTPGRQNNMAAKLHSERVPSLPKYRVTLALERRKSYDEKLKLIENIDPYNVSNFLFSDSMELWPEIEFPDIANYLIFSTSSYTKEQLKAYKSLDAYNYFVAGWVRCIFVGKATDNIKILIGKVNHSQRMNETPLKPWVAATNEGTVVTAHCNCMAGLGGACSHVGAILFAVEAGVRIKRSTTCTSVPCKWLMPTPVIAVSYQELRDIDFTSSKTKKRKLDSKISGLSSDTSKQNSSPAQSDAAKNVFVPSQTDIKKFFESLNASKTHPAILSLIPPYNMKYCPKADSTELPKPLTRLYDSELCKLDFEDLLEKSNRVFEAMNISIEQAKAIEEATRNQSKSSLWFDMRAGRITASKFHQACHTDPASPSISLIKDVCYGSKFSSKATAWGNTHEKHALDRYRQVMQDEHKDFGIKDSGFVINPEHPHLGASPDAISYCSCHGTGCVEIKCPYKAQDSTITEAVGFLEKTANGCLQLDRKHLYYAQVQLQLSSTKLDFVDFVV
ncbi:uncharacterized protein LOC141874140 [Acropora palmata]|uniref:uncharacterized protein LOC141874140 n=1 Tax=Acropora palmata TaxID=6131 RepID=UPI003D9FB451